MSFPLFCHQILCKSFSDLVTNLSLNLVTKISHSGHSLILNLFKWSCRCYLFNQYILYKSYQIWSENSLKIGPKICSFLKIWPLNISCLLPFILRTNFRMSSKSWDLSKLNLCLTQVFLLKSQFLQISNWECTINHRENSYWCSYWWHWRKRCWRGFDIFIAILIL